MRKTDKRSEKTYHKSYVNAHLENALRLPHYNNTTTRYILIRLEKLMKRSMFITMNFTGTIRHFLRFLRSVASFRLQSTG